MLEVFDKTGNIKQLAEKSDLVYVASTGYNKVGTKFQIDLDLPNSADKTAVLVLGTHNTSAFMSLIYVAHGSPDAQISNLSGSVTVTSVSSYDDKLTIRINTVMYGLCVVVSPVPILSAICAN